MLTKWHSKRKNWCNGKTRFVPNTCAHIELRAKEKWKGEKSGSVTLRCPLQPSWEGAAGSCLSAPPPPHRNSNVDCSMRNAMRIRTVWLALHWNTIVHWKIWHCGRWHSSSECSLQCDCWPGGLGSWHQPPPASPALLHNNFFSQHLESNIMWCTIAGKGCNMLFAPICHT